MAESTNTDWSSISCKTHAYLVPCPVPWFQRGTLQSPHKTPIGAIVSSSWATRSTSVNVPCMLTIVKAG